MTKRKPAKTALRRRAEARVPHPTKPKTDETRVVHELEVHQVELEMQNEELRLARQTTETALARYTEIFEFAPIGYALLSGKGEIREINHAGARLLGRERSKYVGTRFVTHVADADLAKFDRLLGTALVSAKSESCEIDLNGIKGPCPVRITASALHREHPVFVIAFEDISERKARELQLAESEEALRELNRRKDDFIAMLSHELRNPLSPIRTSVAVLQLAPPGSEPAMTAIDIIDRSAAHLTRLVDDLLDVTRITRGKIELQREQLELVSLVRRAVDDHANSLVQRRLQIEIRSAPPELWVDGDASRLLQVLSNVLANAQKFTPAGGRIMIDILAANDFGVVRVRDTGVGISPELLPHVFEPFMQAPQALDREGGGLGLGLAMVKSLVELHGGEVQVHSAGLGRGTEVEIRLPAHTAVPAGARSQLATSAGPCKRVLVVEDKPDNAVSLQHALTIL
ncbi:MAG TPA: PAS domain-containing sensor histidine kinase, partial [Kofleriaceae bacterium]